ncbi:hypothetical protein ACWCPM_15980 [Streptomyces sp. NPDC002309]
MQREDTQGSGAASGLSTDDLAHPQERSTLEGAGSTPTDVPTFPGESTNAPGNPAGEKAAGAGVGTQNGALSTDESGLHQAPGQDSHAEGEVHQLLSPQDEQGFRARWQEVQNKFVDDPRDAVHTADALVADVMQRLATTFADHKQELEDQWNRGEQANTEDLRQALRHYRSFFNRLLVT